MGCERHGPTALPAGKIRYPFYRRLGGRQGRSGRVRKISRSPGFHPRIVQLVPSSYTDCAIPAHLPFHKIATFCFVVWLVGWSFGGSVGLSVCRSVGWLVDWVFVRLFGWLVGWLLSYLVVWLVGCLVGLLVDWLMWLIDFWLAE